MPVVTKIVTGVYVYNEGYPKVKQQIASIVCYSLCTTIGRERVANREG